MNLVKAMILVDRLTIAWSTTILFLLFGERWLADLSSPPWAILLYFWLFAVILSCAFRVVKEADHLAEPLGALILTLSIVIMEVVLIGAVIVVSEASPTLGRDALFAVLMIVLNGVVGAVLLLTRWRHRAQVHGLHAAVAYLAVIIPLSALALILPSFTQAIPVGSLTATHAVLLSFVTVLVYGIFLVTETGRHRRDFVEPNRDGVTVAGARDRGVPPARTRGRQMLLLVITMLPVVLLAKYLATLVDHGIAVLGAPPALGAAFIALIVFTPVAITAVRTALGNQLQRSINLSLGASTSTIGLAVPTILGLGFVTDKVMVLGLDPTAITLLALTLGLSALTFSGLGIPFVAGMVHLVIFFAYIVSIFGP